MLVYDHCDFSGLSGWFSRMGGAAFGLQRKVFLGGGGGGCMVETRHYHRKTKMTQ